MTLALHGLGVSRGIAIGKTYVLARDAINIVEYRVEERDIEAEVERFQAALQSACDQLRHVRDQIPKHTPVDIRSFIDTHLLMLEDAAFSQVPVDIIRIRRCNAEWALKLQRDALVKVFEQMEDAYLRTRRDDVDYVVNQIQRVLLNQAVHPAEGAESHLRGAVVIADDLSPADTVFMQHHGVIALVTEYGGTTSHTAILARSLGIPAVVGMHNARRYLRNDELVIVDGRQGLVLADADRRTIDYFQQRRYQELAYNQALEMLKGQPAITRDKKKVDLLANIELAEDLDASRRYGAEGIGLFRTELLFLNRSELPGEDEQLEEYRDIITALDGRPVTIRTLDVGADKNGVWQTNMQPAINPALSLRGIRWCLKEPGVLGTQLRAILRASAYGPVRVMVPMVTTIQELMQVLRFIEEKKQELRRDGLAFDSKIAVGAMIEVPAAAMIADVFARHLNFLSIGTNDLIQYTVAADRLDDGVNYLYDPLHPGVLRLITRTIEAGRKSGIPVTMCGEMAGDVRFTRLLLGMGLREFSMHPSYLLEVKRCVKDSDIGALTRQVQNALDDGDSDNITKLVESLHTTN